MWNRVSAIALFAGVWVGSGSDDLRSDPYVHCTNEFWIPLRLRWRWRSRKEHLKCYAVLLTAAWPCPHMGSTFVKAYTSYIINQTRDHAQNTWSTSPRGLSHALLLTAAWPFPHIGSTFIKAYTSYIINQTRDHAQNTWSTSPRGLSHALVLTAAWPFPHIGSTLVKAYTSYNINRTHTHQL